MHLAARYGHNKVLKTLLKNGAKVDAQITKGMYKDYTPLHLAAEYSHYNVIKTFIDFLGNDEVELQELFQIKGRNGKKFL